MEVKIFIAIPSNRGLKAKMVESLAQLIAKTDHEVKTQVAIEGYTIAENRAFLVWQAKKWGATHILFIDDDMVFPPDTLDRLLERKVQVIGVNAYGRKLPLKTTVTFWEKDWIDGENGMPKLPEMPTDIFECKEVGAGIMLVEMSVFEEIKEPWFSIKMQDNGWHEQGEDGWFCEKVREKGIKIYCDPTLSIGHIGDFNYTKQ